MNVTYVGLTEVEFEVLLVLCYIGTYLIEKCRFVHYVLIY